jgi:hypothetical protein
MERRGPAAETRSRTHRSASPSACVSGNGRACAVVRTCTREFLCVRVILCARTCMCDVWVCACAHTRTGIHERAYLAPTERVGSCVCARVCVRACAQRYSSGCTARTCVHAPARVVTAPACECARAFVGLRLVCAHAHVHTHTKIPQYIRTTCLCVCARCIGMCPSVRPELHCIGPVPVGHGRRGARRPSPENSDRPPHPPLSFAFTSAPCASSAATTAACPFQAAEWSGVFLR